MHSLSYAAGPAGGPSRAHKHPFAVLFLAILTVAAISALVVCHYLNSWISLPLL